MRNGTIKWIQLKSYCRYPYDSFFKIKYIMCASKSTPHPPAKKNHFYEKCRILKTLPCIEKRRNGLSRDRTYPNHFQKQKRKSGVSFRSWIQNCKKRCFPPKRQNNVIWLKFVEERCAICTIQLLSTTCWKTSLNIFIPDDNIAI